MDADKQPSKRDDFFLGVRCNVFLQLVLFPEVSIVLILIFIFWGEGYQLLLYTILSSGNVAKNPSNGLKKILVLPKQ